MVLPKSHQPPSLIKNEQPPRQSALSTAERFCFGYHCCYAFSMLLVHNSPEENKEHLHQSLVLFWRSPLPNGHRDHTSFLMGKISFLSGLYFKHEKSGQNRFDRNPPSTELHRLWILKQVFSVNVFDKRKDHLSSDLLNTHNSDCSLQL